MKYMNGEGTASIDVYDPQKPLLVFNRGSYTDISSVRVSLEMADINKILILNHVLDDSGEKMLNMPNTDREIEKRIYEPLSKYILQMLYASRGTIYPEIKGLQKHKIYHFKNTLG